MDAAAASNSSNTQIDKVKATLNCMKGYADLQGAHKHSNISISVCINHVCLFPRHSLGYQHDIGIG